MYNVLNIIHDLIFGYVSCCLHSIDKANGIGRGYLGAEEGNKEQEFMLRIGLESHISTVCACRTKHSGSTESESETGNISMSQENPYSVMRA